MSLKVCKGCSESLSIDKFRKQRITAKGTQVYKSKCFSCDNSESLERYHRLTVEQKRKRGQAFKDRNPDYNKQWHRQTKYGLTDEEYQALLVMQQGRCYICKSIKRLVVDHCHKSGKTRKLLCHSCNTALGHAKEDQQILLNMIEYIKEHGYL